MDEVRIFKDGNEYCAVGEGFVNLQESDNYAFGRTRAQALENLERLMS